MIHEGHYRYNTFALRISCKLDHFLVVVNLQPSPHSMWKRLFTLPHPFHQTFKCQFQLAIPHKESGQFTTSTFRCIPVWYLGDTDVISAWYLGDTPLGYIVKRTSFRTLQTCPWDCGHHHTPRAVFYKRRSTLSASRSLSPPQRRPLTSQEARSAAPFRTMGINAACHVKALHQTPAVDQAVGRI
jgi:hypothetical protein